MTSSTPGSQRADRRSDRNGAGRRFLAALGASVVLGFGVGAPIAAAQTAAQVPRRDSGGSNSRSDNGDARLREQVERLSRELLAGRQQRERREGSPSVGPTVTPPTVPPVTVPVAGPPVGVPAVAAPTSGPVTASATPTASRTGAALAGAAARTGVNGTAAGAGVLPPGVAPSPPAAAPSTTPRSGVARALRTARSYGALLALAAAVVIFLGVQGRLDRRDPRILSAPVEDHLSFRDFE